MSITSLVISGDEGQGRRSVPPGLKVIAKPVGTKPARER
jgi:hypothetical protein